MLERSKLSKCNLMVLLHFEKVQETPPTTHLLRCCTLKLRKDREKDARRRHDDERYGRDKDVKMKQEEHSQALADFLRLARPRLICRVDPEGGQHFRLTSFVSETERGWDEVLTEGYDPKGSPLGCPVYWRIVNRGDEQLHCSTFLATRDQIIKGWGKKGLAYRNPVTGTAVVQIETSLVGAHPLQQ